jgi:hypothetical protein
MAKLCESCAKKKADTSVRGSCNTPSNPGGSLPQGHNPWTESPMFSLCDACAEQFKTCAWCLGPLDGSGAVTVPTEKQFCRQFLQDDGKHVKAMYVGEQILVQLPYDRWSWKTWGVDYLSYGIEYDDGRVVGVPGDDDYYSYWYGPREGWLEMYFNLTEADSKGVIRLKERGISNWWGTPTITNPKTWEITVEIKR